MMAVILMKRIAALAVLIAFFLPLSQCSSRVSEESATTPVNQKITNSEVNKETVQASAMAADSVDKASAKSVQKNYAYKEAPWLSWRAFFMYGIFLWPCLLVLMATWRSNWQSKLPVNIVELGLALSSIAVLIFFNLFYELLFGAYLALAGWTMYGLAAASVLWQRLRLWRKSSVVPA
jgi:hypothetical protein